MRGRNVYRIRNRRSQVTASCSGIAIWRESLDGASPLGIAAWSSHPTPPQLEMPLNFLSFDGHLAFARPMNCCVGIQSSDADRLSSKLLGKE
jgi:hypothetical protein